MWSKTQIGLRVKCRRFVVLELHVKCPVFLSYLNCTSIFLTYFRMIFKYQISSKPVKCSTQTDGRTDDIQTYMTKLKAAFRNFANKLKVCSQRGVL